MNGFQIVGITGCALLSLWTIWRITRDSERLRLFAWLLLWIAAAVCIANPRLVTLTARTLGIGRGADLLLYATALVMLAGFYLVVIQFRRLDRQVSQLVRYIAIREAEWEEALEQKKNP